MAAVGGPAFATPFPVNHMNNKLHMLVLAMLLLGFGAGHALAAEADSKQGEFPREWFFGDDNQRKKHNELVGQQAPLLDLSHWRNGEVTAEDMKGKIVVVDFWATWCGPCIAAIPHNNEMAEQYKDQGVIVLGVSGSEHGQEKTDEVVKEHNIQYPVARDAENRSAPAWRVMWWPTYGVIDREGNLRALGLKPNYVDDVVERLLKEQPQSSEEQPAQAAAE